MFEKMATNPESEFLIEQPRFSEEERKFSRRQLFIGARNIIAAAATAKAATELTEGISLRQPPLVLRPLTVDRKGKDVELFPTGGFDEEEKWSGILTLENKLLVEPFGDFFTDDRDFSYAHRANDPEFIRRAFNQGANLFDIDANDVNGRVYAEHGIIPQIDIRLGKRSIRLHADMVVDPNEYELKLGMPEYTYEELVAFIASLSTPEHPLAVSTELKRGNFDIETLYTMLAVHRRYNIPAIMHSTDPKPFDAFGPVVAQS